MYHVDIVFSLLDDDSTGRLSFHECFTALIDPKLFLK